MQGYFAGSLSAGLGASINGGCFFMEQLCSKGHLPPLHGSSWLSFLRRWSRLKSDIQLLTGNCWLAVPSFPISRICWRAGHLQSTQTISHSPMHWGRWLMVGQPCSPMWQNLQQIFATCLVWTMWWPTHCPGHLPTPLDQIADPTPPDRIAASLYSTTSLHSTLLLFLLVRSCWTMLALPRIS